jgi:hypothetical protein
MSVLGLALTILVLIGVAGKAQEGAQDPEGNVGRLNAGTTARDDQETAGPEGPSGDSNVEPEGQPPAGPGPSSEEEVELTEGLEPDAAIFFRRIAGMNFHPLSSNLTYNSTPGGCLYQTGSAGYFASDIQVPDGATIDYLRVYFYDVDGGSDAVAELYAYDGAGNSTLIASAAGSGTPAYGSAVSEPFSHPVDNTGEALAVVLDFQGANSDALKICGIRLRYQIHFSQINLPLVLRQAQP